MMLWKVCSGEMIFIFMEVGDRQPGMRNKERGVGGKWCRCKMTDQGSLQLRLYLSDENYSFVANNYKYKKTC